MKINRKKDQKNRTVQFPTAFQVHGCTRKLWVCSRTASQLSWGRGASLQTLGWAKPSGAAPQPPQPAPSRGEKGPSPGSTQGRGWMHLVPSPSRRYPGHCVIRGQSSAIFLERGQTSHLELSQGSETIKAFHKVQKKRILALLSTKDRHPDDLGIIIWNINVHIHFPIGNFVISLT